MRAWCSLLLSSMHILHQQLVWVGNQLKSAPCNSGTVSKVVYTDHKPCVLSCSMTAFDKDNLNIIFSNLVTWWLHKFNYSQNISKLGKSLVAATLDVYEQVQTQLLPTPTKSHYTFNLRDVSKVFQVCSSLAATVS